MKKLKIIFLVIIITFLVSVTFGQRPKPKNQFGKGNRPPSRDKFLAKKLNLTKEQRIEWRRINQESRQKRNDARLRVKEARDDLDRYIYSDNLNEIDLQKKIDLVIEAEAAITKIRVLSEVSVRNILTREQLVKFREIREQIKETRRKRQLRDQRRNRNPRHHPPPMRRN